MRQLILFLLLLLIPSRLDSQILKGTIKDARGEAIPYATVYIKELKQGTTSNTKGDYEIRLPDGKYTVIYESLGFEPDINNIRLAGNMIILNVTLQVQTYEIPEVRITASGEDPAYGIMRKAIGMAPWYLNHVGSYNADVYLKGNLVLTRIPGIIKRRMQVEAKSNKGASASSTTMKEGDTYMMESFNEIGFTAPDKYNQHVISSRSTFPEQGGEISPMDFIKASFYEPVLNNMFISPLSPEAFSHYRFKYMGLSSEGNYYVDKIEVTPKRKSQQLFEGTIYIIEDLWCLHSVDLVNENIAGKIRVQQLYIPVQEDVWMPVSHRFDVNISILGVKGEASYGSSIKYIEVKLNPNLRKPEGMTEYKGRQATEITPKDTVKSKAAEQIEKILSKNDLSNRDMIKLSGLLNKQSKKSFPDSMKKNLEVKEKTTYVIEKDADRKDSTFWAGIRPIPLSANELRSLHASDSTKAGLSSVTLKNDTAKKTSSEKNGFFPFMGKLAFGHTWSDTTGSGFTNGGLLNLKNLNFNTVDGLVYGVDFRINKTWKKRYRLGIYPTFLYAFSREAFMWRINSQFSFGNMGQTQIFIRTGDLSKDINGSSGIVPLVNSVTTLFLESNYLKLYEGKFITAGYRTEITNGLYIDLQAGYENRKILSNTTDFTIINTSKSYTGNIPVNSFLQNPSDPYYALRDHTHGDMTLALQYTPMQRYAIQGESKIPRGSDWPTFSVSWKHGINDFTGSFPSLQQYDLFRFEVFQRMSTGAMGEFRWRYTAGGFLKNTGFSFIDFNHFNSQYFPVLLRDYEDAFMLPQFYSQSTPEMFSELHTKYTTPYLLIKLIPGLSNTLMRENLSLSFLWSKYHEAYTELGYSISEILLLGELGVYAGFNNFSYNSIGIKIVFRLN
jgi:Family of unknown function (DUF5686)/CarboxypepD_reg-like domain